MRSLSVRTALFLHVVLPTALLLIGGGFVGLRAAEAWSEERMQREVELVARAIRLPLSRSMELQRPTAVAQTLESAFETAQLYGAYVYDADGEKVASIGRDDALGEEDQERLSEIAQDERRGEYGEVGGAEVYSYFIPLLDSGGRLMGLLHVTRERSDIEARLATLRWRLGSGLGALVLLIGGLMFVGHRRAVGRHLDRLEASMGIVESGDRTHRVSVSGPVEVGSLARTFNAMLDSIEEAQREIADRRRVEAELEQELHRRSRLAAIGKIAGGIAHEIGAPLSVIDGKARRALRNPDLPESLQADLEAIRRQVRRVERIVRQLLDFGRTDDQSTDRRAPLARVVPTTVMNVRQEIEEQNRIEFDPGDDGDRLPVVVDAVRFEQALANLIRNALYASRSTVRVSHAVDEGGRAASVVVEDDGPGVPADLTDRIFEPFFTTKPQGSGSGLGLAFVQRVVEDHGGVVTLDRSEDLGGACFTVRLPVDSEFESTAHG